MASGRIKWEPDQYVTHLHLRALEEAWQEPQTLLAGFFGTGGKRLLKFQGLNVEPVTHGAQLRFEQLAWVDHAGQIFSVGWEEPVLLNFTRPRRLQLQSKARETWLTRDTTVVELAELGLPEAMAEQCVRIHRADPAHLLEVVEIDSGPDENALPLGTLAPGERPFVLTFRLDKRDWLPPFATVASLRAAADALGHPAGLDLVANLEQLLLHPTFQARPELRAALSILRRRAGPFAGPPLTPAELAAAIESLCILANGVDLAGVLELPSNRVEDRVFARGYLPADLLDRVQKTICQERTSRWRRAAAEPLPAEVGGRDVMVLGFDVNTDKELGRARGARRLAVVFSEPPEAHVARVGYVAGQLVTASLVRPGPPVLAPADLGIDPAAEGIRSRGRLHAVDLGLVKFPTKQRTLYLYLFGSGVSQPEEHAIFVERS